jgi:hypothetical protein
MYLFPLCGVLRGFLPSTYQSYASGKNPCAALHSEKISHLKIHFSHVQVCNPELPVTYQALNIEYL